MKKTPKVSSIHNPSDGFLGGLRNVILSTKETDGDIYLVEGIMPKDSIVPLHIHELEDEIFHVLEGKVELILGDKTIQAKKDDIIYLPRGIQHGIKTSGNQTAKVLNYVIPGKNFEEFFNKMNAIGLHATTEEKAKIGVEHKIKFL
ncbi:cupin domain-containing protein [Aquimarina algicola]|uniref:Cupin domain-containing protein n=1 Tax=Aquimarina algicola TaxID=2589995 RepID=A0A504ITP7_9FLAO|nr:cupin domain-containing protein [Aquimarina algicola]TPN81374.1 cupin domain-containing protein [Aquimarina algicola]